MFFYTKKRTKKYKNLRILARDAARGGSPIARLHLALPHGGFALTWRATSWQSSGVAISYDRGRSFDYLLTGPYETINAFVIDDDHFVVFTAKSHRSDSSAGVYRWVPGE